jgi:hypothetical protein
VPAATTATPTWRLPLPGLPGDGDAAATDPVCPKSPARGLIDAVLDGARHRAEPAAPLRFVPGAAKAGGWSSGAMRRRWRSARIRAPTPARTRPPRRRPHAERARPHPALRRAGGAGRPEPGHRRWQLHRAAGPQRGRQEHAVPGAQRPVRGRRGRGDGGRLLPGPPALRGPGPAGCGVPAAFAGPGPHRAAQPALPRAAARPVGRGRGAAHRGAGRALPLHRAAGRRGARSRAASVARWNWRGPCCTGRPCC